MSEDESDQKPEQEDFFDCAHRFAPLCDCWLGSRARICTLHSGFSLMTDMVSASSSDLRTLCPMPSQDSFVAPRFGLFIPSNYFHTRLLGFIHLTFSVYLFRHLERPTKLSLWFYPEQSQQSCERTLIWWTRGGNRSKGSDYLPQSIKGSIT